MADVREKLVELESALRKSMCRGYDDVTDIEYIEYEETAKNLIANGVTIQKWIPVTERLPEKGDKYLCIVKSCLFRGATYQTILGYDKGGFHDGCICMEDVTHWMPLPEPPGDCHGLRPRNDGEVAGDG